MTKKKIERLMFDAMIEVLRAGASSGDALKWWFCAEVDNEHAKALRMLRALAAARKIRQEKQVKCTEAERIELASGDLCYMLATALWVVTEEIDDLGSVKVNPFSVAGQCWVTFANIVRLLEYHSATLSMLDYIDCGDISVDASVEGVLPMLDAYIKKHRHE